METLEEMIENISDSSGTQATYKSYLKKCFKILNENPEKYFNKTTDEYGKDTLKILKTIKNDPPKTKQTIMYAWKSLLEYHDITLKPSIKKTIRNKTRGRPVSEEINITPKMLKEILSTGGIKERTLFLLLATSGIRIGEALKLRVDEHLELTNNPPKIRITADIAEKGDKRITFITDESKEYLIKWLKQRDRYIKNKEPKCNFKIEMDLKKYENRVFPFSKRVCELWWYKLSENAGYTEKDERTGRRKTTIHQLRKYFRTTLGTEIKQDIIEALMGHTNALQSAYRRYTEQTLGNEYKKGMRALYVFKTDTVTKEEFETMKEQQQFYEKRLTNANNEIASFKERFSKMEQNLDTIFNPETQENQNWLSLFEGMLPELENIRLGREMTDKETEIVKDLVRKETPAIFNKLRKLTTEEIIDIAKIKDINEINKKIKDL